MNPRMQAAVNIKQKTASIFNPVELFMKTGTRRERLVLPASNVKISKTSINLMKGRPQTSLSVLQTNVPDASKGSIIVLIPERSVTLAIRVPS